MKLEQDIAQLFAEALALLASKRLPEAYASLRQVIAGQPAYEPAWEQIAAVLPAVAGEPEAIELASAARAVPVRSKNFWYELAQNLHGEDAQRCYRDALAADPQFEPALSELAWSLRSSGRKEEAKEFYEQLLHIYIRRADSRALNSLGDTLRRLVGDLDLAEQAFDRALTLKPDDFETWKHLAYLKLSRRQPALAQQTLRRFIQTYAEHPQLADAWVCLGTVLRSCDDFTGAEEAVRKAVAHDPSSQAAWSKLADILFDRGAIEEAQEALRQADDLDYNKRYDAITVDPGE